VPAIAPVTHLLRSINVASKRTKAFKEILKNSTTPFQLEKQAYRLSAERSLGLLQVILYNHINNSPNPKEIK